VGQLVLLERLLVRARADVEQLLTVWKKTGTDANRF
jgi:hypothetical protein